MNLSEQDQINAKLQLDLAQMVNATKGNKWSNLQPWLNAVMADLKQGNTDGAVHLLQTIIIAIQTASKS